MSKMPNRSSPRRPRRSQSRGHPRNTYATWDSTPSLLSAPHFVLIRSNQFIWMTARHTGFPRLRAIVIDPSQDRLKAPASRNPDAASMPLMPCRMSVTCCKSITIRHSPTTLPCRPVVCASGTNDAISAQSISFKSVWYRFETRVCCARGWGPHQDLRVV